MPHLLIRGLSVDEVRTISRPLVADLAGLCQCPPDYFMLECLHTTAIFDGETVPSYPFVDVSWFDRGTEIRDRFAETVDRHIRSLGIPEAEIAFRAYREDQYYINGKPAGTNTGKDESAALRQELQLCREANTRLREQLQKTARKSSVSGPDANMSSKLRDALRE
jgi:hypothetical protein